MTWLVTGGAGFIGAHVVREMEAAGHDVVVLDDLSSGSRDRIPNTPLVVGTVLDRTLVERTLAQHAVHGVVHVAGRKQVAESVARPFYYYRENVGGQLNLLEAMCEVGVDKLVFSSSASVYGMPDVDLVDEATPVNPLSPYGQTKAAGEWMVEDAATAFGLTYMNLRYFNVAGAATAQLGDPAALNLIPMIFERLTEGRRPRLFGADYPTPDGTCVRDFIHVEDIARAHVASVEHLETSGPSCTLNIGRGQGASVLEVLRAISEVTGLDTTPEVLPRRAGDPARVVASADRITEVLGWVPKYDLTDMVSSAWAAWQLRHPAARALSSDPLVPVS